MTLELIHTCYRITDPDRSVAFYEALGLEKRRELPIRDEAMNYFLGVPGVPQPELELTYNFGVDSYELGTGMSPLRSIQSGISPSSCANRSGLKRKSRSVIFVKSGSGPMPKSSWKSI
jgi:catechol 2,3-dioxygenase-like lactoylglutathione lyase family enzyme